MLEQAPAQQQKPAREGADAIEARGVHTGYGRRPILAGVDLRVRSGSVTALVGPNGSGKSTLLKVCSRLLGARGGGVLLDGHDIATLSTRAVAQKLAILPQGPSAPPHLTIRDLVEQGRYPWVGSLRMLRRQDAEAIDRAIALVGLAALADRDVDTLSGGERQRAWLALALAQETALLALDEPTTFLDIGHQFEVLELVRRLNAERGLTVLMVLHDLNHAATFADHLVMLAHGQVVAAGEPWSILEPDLLRDVFGVAASVVRDPTSGKPLIVPHGSAARATPAG
jgi:iron complex transport system ATP-binding protein